MGRAFNRMEKRVEGRHSSRQRFVRSEDRIRAVEVAMLELMHYVTRGIATDKDSPDDLALVQAAADFEQSLEKTVK